MVWLKNDLDANWIYLLTLKFFYLFVILNEYLFCKLNYTVFNLLTSGVSFNINIYFRKLHPESCIGILADY